MARPKKTTAAEPSATDAVEDSGTTADEAGAIEDGKILDYITDKPVVENDKERVRQRIARALFHEYGINVDDMVPDFKVKVEESGRSSNKKIDIAIFESGAEHAPENVRRLVVCQKELKLGDKGAYKMRDHDQAAKDLDLLKEAMAACQNCKYGLWTNGLEFFFFQVKRTKETFGAEPRALRDVLLLAPADKLDERRQEYPDIEVRPLKFGAGELQTSHWRFLMGAVGNQATYIRQLNRVMKSLRDDLTLAGLNEGIEASSLPDHLKSMAKMRLELAAEYIDDSVRLKEEIRPGRLIIVDLRDEFIEKDEALGLFVVLLQLFADAKYRDSQGVEHSFNKLVVFDEAHKYIESPDLVAGLIDVVREMRHKGTSIMVASQDPPSVPISLIELSSQVILHKFNSPAWLKHIQKANAALGSLTPEKMSNLRPGEAFIWSSKATDDAFTKSAVKIRCRPRVTRHGGATKTAVGA